MSFIRPLFNSGKWAEEKHHFVGREAGARFPGTCSSQPMGAKHPGYVRGIDGVCPGYVRGIGGVHSIFLGPHCSREALRFSSPPHCSREAFLHNQARGISNAPSRFSSSLATSAYPVDPRILLHHHYHARSPTSYRSPRTSPSTAANKPSPTALFRWLLSGGSTTSCKISRALWATASRACGRS